MSPLPALASQHRRRRGGWWRRFGAREVICRDPLRVLKGDCMFFRLTALAGALLMLAACSTRDGGGARRTRPPGGSWWPGRDRRVAVRPGVATGPGGDGRRPDFLRFRQFRNHPRGAARAAASGRMAETLFKCERDGRRPYRRARYPRIQSRPGERRAQAARNVLVAMGIPAARISTISYGKERPAVPGSTEEAYGQNRRAVTVVN